MTNYLPSERSEHRTVCRTEGSKPAGETMGHKK